MSSPFGEGAVVEVTQEDIDLASSISSDRCPIARAIERKFAVAGAYAGFSSCGYRGGEIAYYMPFEAREFVNAFDAGQKVEPFTFVVGRDFNNETLNGY